MESSGEHKRLREEDADEMESPEVKRLRADLLFDILDDDSGAGDQDLASVIKSLEEEIALPSPHPKTQLAQEPSDVAGQPDLGYLLEASDDELGLPPTAALWSVDEAAGASELGSVAEPEGSAGLGQIWGFDDAIDGYEGFGLGIRPEEREAAEDGLVLDGGLFDYGDELSGPYDLSWRPESLPAV
ncbi:hypothetical protein OPV22_009169 [Ensete ventricosum]|uniref:Uncharacterized protein n=1 Tax=Ensete ventricosum TaxID=4639 RepID=A0AAV8RIK5_ENSVE|nr:hypothetical protein OPV22_009169 [Ensete ventricosum]